MGNASSGEDVKLLVEIGQGSYAVVYKALWSHQHVAAKKLHPYLFEKRDVAKKFREEWELLSSLNHENIVKYLTVVLPQTPDDTPVIITELLEQDLRNFIRNSKTNPKVSFGNAISILLDVGRGLDYLHQPPRFIVHRDLASKNILLTSTGRAKIADFGFARSFPEGEMIASANPGTMAYRAPETYGRLGWSRKAKYSEKSDVFSFGVVLLEVIVGHVSIPSADIRTEDGTPVPEDWRRSQDLNEMGNEHPLRPLVLSCIMNDPRQRPTAAELVNVLSGFKVNREVLRSHDDLQGKKGKSVYRVSADQCDYEFKVMMVGEMAVGKTSIVTKFVEPNRPFQERLPSTIQFGEFHQRFQLKGKSVVLHVFDTCGELNVHSILPQLYRGAHGAVVVFDVTSWDSLQKVRLWVSTVRDRCGEYVPIILAGNKTDCGRREVDTRTAEDLCEEFQLFYIEVSAKTGKNIDEIFSVLTEKLMQQKDEQDGAGSSTNVGVSNNVGPLSMLHWAITEKEPAKPRKVEKDPESICLEDNTTTTGVANSKGHGTRKPSCC